MKPAPFQYVAPDSLAEALAALRAYGPEAKVLAGGQSLVPLLNMRLARPQVIVDLNRVRELDYIRDDGAVAIGAMTRQRAAELSPVVRRNVPLLAEALRFVGHPQIRNRGTVGGSLAHADPAAELPAVAAALDATFVVQGPAGKRRLSASEFFVSYLTTALAPDELLVEVRFPVQRRMGSAFLEVARRHGDYALVGVAAAVRMRRRTIAEARLAFTGVGPVPVRLPEAEALLAGRKPDDLVLDDLARLVADRLDPPDDIHASSAYRRHVAGVLARRALVKAAQEATASSRPDDGEPRAENPPPAAAPARRPGRRRRTAPAAVARREIELRVNGRTTSASVDVRMTLADFIRERLGLTGTHLGCEHGVCGACTILLDGKAVRSCLMFAAQADGAEVLTVEGLGTPERLHPLQEAFREHHGLQCGFCTPGFLMSALAFLRERPRPDEAEIREALAGNLCRCTGYQGIVEAVKAAADRMGDAGVRERRNAATR